MNAQIKGQLEVLMAIENLRGQLKHDATNMEMMLMSERLASLYMLINTDVLIDSVLKSEGMSFSKQAS